MQDVELRLTPTHAADEFQGAVLGIQTTLFVWVALSLLASVALFAWLYYAHECDFFDAAQWAVIPSIVMFAYLRFAHQGRPPGFTLDLLDSVFTGGHAKLPQQFQHHPLHYV